MTLLRRPRRSTSTVALAAGALLLAACGGGADSTPFAAPGSADGASSAPVPPAGADEALEADRDTAEAFASAFASASAIDGEFDVASLAGKDVVLWFWAPWCTACRAEAPSINEIVERFGADVEIIGVAGRSDVASMRSFIDDTGTGGMMHIADESGGVWSSFGVFAQPAFAFINDTGEIETFVGGLRTDDLADRIEGLLAT